MNQGSVILYLVVVLVVGADFAVATALKCSQYVYGWVRIQCRLAVVVPQILKARFIDNLCSKNLGVTDLHGLFGGSGVVGLGRQNSLPNTVVRLRVPVVLITRG